MLTMTMVMTMMMTTVMVMTMTTKTTNGYWTQRTRRCSKCFTHIKSLGARSQDLHGPSTGAGVGGPVSLCSI